MYLLPITALGLLAVSGMLLDSHRRTWRAAEQDRSLDDRDLRAARAIYLRRMQSSGTIGLIGLLLIVRPIIPEQPLWMLLYLLGLVLLCGWIMVLAMIDALAAKIRNRQSRHQVKSAHEKLEAEIAKIDEIRMTNDED